MLAIIKNRRWIKTSLIVGVIFACYYAYFNTAKHWLTPVEVHKPNSHQFIQALLVDTKFLPEGSESSLLNSLSGGKFSFNHRIVEIDVSASPKWQKQFSHSNALQQIENDLSSFKEGHESFSIQLKNGKWLNYTSRQKGWDYPFLVALFGGFWLLILLIALYAVFVITLTNSLGKVKSSARRLKLDIHSKINKGYNFLILKGTMQAMQDMQAYIVKLVTQKSYILGMISHDLRQPLMRLQIKLDELQDQKLVKSMSKDITEMREMVDSLVEYTRDDVYREQRTVVDIVALLWSCADQYFDEGKNLDVKMPEMRIPIWGSSNSLKRCFTNVLSNAFKYANSAQLSLEVEREQVVVTITDDGSGVSEHELAKLTKPFFRAGSGRGKAKGSGLGLAIVNEIIQNHDGSLEIRNAINGGLSVAIYFDIYQPKG